MNPQPDDARLLMLFKSIGAVVVILAAFGLVFWLVEGGFWLKFLLAAVMASGANAGITASLDKAQLAKQIAAQAQQLQALETRLARLNSELERQRTQAPAGQGEA